MAQALFWHDGVWRRRVNQDVSARRTSPERQARSLSTQESPVNIHHSVSAALAVVWPRFGLSGQRRSKPFAPSDQISWLRLIAPAPSGRPDSTRPSPAVALEI